MADDAFFREACEDEIVAEAETSVGRTPRERYEMFRLIQMLVGAIWASFDEREMRRRLRIAEELDPRPDPGWKDIRPEGM